MYLLVIVSLSGQHGLILGDMLCGPAFRSAGFWMLLVILCATLSMFLVVLCRISSFHCSSVVYPFRVSIGF